MRRRGSEAGRGGVAAFDANRIDGGERRVLMLFRTRGRALSPTCGERYASVMRSGLLVTLVFNCRLLMPSG